METKITGDNSVVFAFGDENYNPTTASVGAGGTWTQLASNPTDFNIWTWTKSGNEWAPLGNVTVTWST